MFKLKPKKGFNVVARFIGSDGSLGYKRGHHTYRLTLHQLGKTILVVPSGKSTKTLPCPYANLELFLQNWQIERLVENDN